MFNKKILLFTLMLLASLTVSLSQNVGVKSNLAYWGTTTPNIGVELSLSKKTTLDIIGGLNPFDFSENRKFKHLLVQPELRYWFCETFNGHFVGLHAHGAQYNVEGIDIPLGRLEAFKDTRYQGYLYGGGISYGYQWILSPRWNFELSAGGGYARIHYDEFPCAECGTKLDEGTYNYFGVTKAAVSLIFFLK